MFDTLKNLNISNLFFEKGAAKKHRFFIFLQGHYFVMSVPIDMNFDVF